MKKINVFDVAVYLLKKFGAVDVTAMKFQKLIYYCQAWSLVWDDQPLFDEKIEAWINGPVVPELYKLHRECYIVKSEMFENKATGLSLSQDQKETIEAVIKYYGDKSSQWLSDLTHLEDPWKKARRGLPSDVRGNQEIGLLSMVEYYSNLASQAQ